MRVETFDADWLRLRERVDHRSRSVELTDALVDWWEGTGGHAVLDLGTGTGSNLRYLAPRLPKPQAWTLIDHDEELLARVGASTGEVEVATRACDLMDMDRYRPGDGQIVTASALLDLTSASWAARLVEECVAAGSAVLFALTYDGSIEWVDDPSPTDDVVRHAVNAHQRRNKGFGAALGSDAGHVVASAFHERGWRTEVVPSPWVLGPEDAELARQVVTGWEGAAMEERPELAQPVRDWANARRAAISEGDVALTVGHVDVLALPPTGA